MFNHQRLLCALLAASLVLPACKSSEKDNGQARRTETTTKTVTIQQSGEEGLDLSLLPEMVAEAENGEDLEKMLNTSDINNLDLNGDNKIDYLNVEEYREGPDRGFLLFTNEEGQRHELARVQISRQSQTADVVVNGNPEYYGNNTRYHSSFPLGEILLVGWLFNMSRPRYYHTPYYVGRYPTYYRTRRPVSSSLYRSRLRSASTRSRLKTTSKSRPTTTYKSTSTNKAGATKAANTSSTKKSLSNVQGNSFSTTSKKRPAGSSTTSSNRSSTGSSFGSSSSRKRSSTNSSSSRSSSFGSSSSRRRSSSSFGSSSRRRRR